MSSHFFWRKQDERGVIGKVKEESDTLQTAVLFKVAGEKTGGLQVNTHSTEDNREVVLVAIVHALVRDTLLLHQACLPTNLGGNLVMWETGSGEDGNLLATGDRVHGVDGGDTGGDHLFRVHLVSVSTDNS